MTNGQRQTIQVVGQQQGLLLVIRPAFALRCPSEKKAGGIFPRQHTQFQRLDATLPVGQPRRNQDVTIGCEIGQRLFDLTRELFVVDVINNQQPIAMFAQPPQSLFGFDLFISQPFGFDLQHAAQAGQILLEVLRIIGRDEQDRRVVLTKPPGILDCQLGLAKTAQSIDRLRRDNRPDRMILA